MMAHDLQETTTQHRKMQRNAFRSVCAVAGIVVLLMVLSASSSTLAAPAASDSLANTTAQAIATEISAAAQVADPAAPPASGAQMALRILIMMTALSLLPAIILTMTCFTRIIIVFSFLRQALGIQGMPPNQIMVGMALFLTAFVMGPVAEHIRSEAIEPLMADEISVIEAVDRAQAPISGFMLANTDDDDLRLFYEISERALPETREDVDFSILVPAFTLSEVRTAFQMGFLVLLPFMVIDLVVASVLMAMGMMMLPPALIALPLKIMVFVLADGWGLIIGSLARSFRV